jgi:hypothetical protein
MRNASILAVLAACLVAVGCLPDTSGIDPPNDEFIYPVGVATVADDQFLLVVNSNFDLEFRRAVR